MGEEFLSKGYFVFKKLVEYLGEIETVFENILTWLSCIDIGLINEKETNACWKYSDTFPLSTSKLTNKFWLIDVMLLPLQNLFWFVRTCHLQRSGKNADAIGGKKCIN